MAEKNCTNQMKAGGFTSGYTVSGATITYSGNMTIASNLSIATCDLKIIGTLKVNSGITLTVNSLTAEVSTGIDYAIYNSGTIKATTVKGTGSGEAGGITINQGTIEATGDVSGFANGTYGAGIALMGGTITAQNIIAKSEMKVAIQNQEGTITANGNIIATGGSTGFIQNVGGKTTAQNITASGTAFGIYLSDGVMTVKYNITTTGGDYSIIIFNGASLTATNIYYCGSASGSATGNKINSCS